MIMKNDKKGATMQKLTLKRLEAIMVKLVKDNQEHAQNIRVRKVNDNFYKVLCDVRYPDLIAKEDHKEWVTDPEFGSGWVEWKKGDNLKLSDKLNMEWVCFGIDKNKDNRFFYSIDGLPSADYFCDTTGYGVLNKGKAVEGLQKDMAKYGMIFEPQYSLTGVQDYAVEL